MSARKSDPENSQIAAENFSKKRSKVNLRIVTLTRASKETGITQAQVVDAIPEYRPGSITPRFARLVERGELVRVYLGMTKPTNQNPTGRPRYVTRVDVKTKQK